MPFIEEAGRLHRAYKERSVQPGRSQPPASDQGVDVHKCDFESTAEAALRPEDREVACNRRFSFPLFVARDRAATDPLVVLLHGLNETEYRKFFPWAASLASEGFSTLLFPIAFHVSRRPRDWSRSESVEALVQQRRTLADNSASSPFNAALSDRFGARPDRFFRGSVQAHRDLVELARQLRSGRFAAANGLPATWFGESTPLPVLGYSLGGYLAMALRLHPASQGSFGRSVVFCSGAPIDGGPGLAADPLSELILDAAARARLRAHYHQARWAEDSEAEDEAAFRAVMLRGEATVGERLGAGRSDFWVAAGREDRVIPLAGIEAQIDRVDQVLELGIHEYPFNVSAYPAEGAGRQIARSYDVAEERRPEFRRFMEATLAHFGR